MTRHHSCRVSPFGHPRIHARLTAPRGLSQPPTSFIGSQCQGIHHAPLLTYKTQKPIIEIAHQRTTTTTPTPPIPHTVQKRQPRGHNGHCSLDARNHYPQIKHHTPPPSGATTTTPKQHGRHPRKGDHRFRFPTIRAKKRRGLVVSKPNSVSSEFPPARTPYKGTPR